MQIKTFFLSILLVALSLPNFIRSTDPQFIMLTIYDYGVNTSHFNVTFLNPAKATNFTEGQYCKLAVIDKEENFDEIDTFAKLYNYNWMFFIEKDKQELIQSTLKHKFNNMDVRAILINFDYDQNITLPLIKINEDNSTEAIKELHYSKQTKNTFLVLSKFKKIIIYPTTYFIIISVVAFTILFVYAFIWVFKFKMTIPTSIITLQKILLYFPIAEVLLNGTILLNVLLVQGNSNESSSFNIYIETALVTINAVFRTILWFLIVLVVCGWQITKQSLTREEMKFYIKVYVFIYIAMCIDQIIDGVFENFLVFSPSEIKNIFLYGIIVSTLTYKGNKSYKYLKHKIVYAMILSREYIPAMLLKMKMILLNVAVVIGYFVLFLIVLIISKVFFSEYSTDDFRIINYHFIDLLLLLSMMTIYYPRKLPDYFTVDYGDDNINDNGEIYIVHLPKIGELKNDILNRELTEKKLKDMYKRKRNDPQKPILVINPFEVENTNINDDKGAQKMNYVNAMIEHVNVGSVEDQ